MDNNKVMNPVLPARPAPSPEAVHGEKEDLTGRDRLVANVIFNWGGQFVFIVAGFILPRMIDRRLGQDILGVWDFAWSLVNYFQLVGAGIASSVNRYVAKYRIAGDFPSLNGIVSSAFAIMAFFGTLILGLTTAVSLLLPQLFGGKLGENVQEAQWVVFFLGASLAVEMALGAYNGILTGCYRWGLQNIINSGWHAVTIAAMVVALLLGYGLRLISLIYLVGTVLAFLTRVVAAHHVCTGLRVRPSLVRWEMIQRVFMFGGKTLIPSVSNVLLNQTTSVLIVAYLNPAALALYTRPRSLVYNAEILVRKMAMTLTPTTSSLQSTGNLNVIRDLVVRAVGYSLYLALPMVLMLAIFGDAIMQVWMGPHYADRAVPAILAVGYLTTMVQAPVLMVLAGMNSHGRAGLSQLAASICAVVLNILVLTYVRWGLVGTAIAVTVPLAIINGVYLPVLICRQVHLSLKHYFLSGVLGPALHVLPFTVCLVVARAIFYTRPLIGLLVGGAVGGVFLIVLYWRHVLPKSLRAKVMDVAHLRRQVSVRA